MAIGLAQMLRKSQISKLKYQKKAYFILHTLIILLTLYSMLLFLLHRFTPLEEVGADKSHYSEVLPEERYGVSDIFTYHFELVQDSSSVSDYVDNLQGSLQGGRSLGMLVLGLTDPLFTHNPHENIFYIVPDPAVNDILTTIYIDVYSDNQRIGLYLFSEITTKRLEQISYTCTDVNCVFVTNFEYQELSEDTIVDLHMFESYVDESYEFRVYQSGGLKLINQ